MMLTKIKQGEHLQVQRLVIQSHVQKSAEMLEGDAEHGVEAGLQKFLNVNNQVWRSKRNDTDHKKPIHHCMNVTEDFVFS